VNIFLHGLVKEMYKIAVITKNSYNLVAYLHLKSVYGYDLGYIGHWLNDGFIRHWVTPTKTRKLFIQML